MSLTNMNREARRPVRSVGVRDLRFAGAVAAGLIAGVLGVGALSAPLLGWSDWPDGLKLGSGHAVTTMKAPAQQVAAVDNNRPTQTTIGPAAVPGVGTVTSLAIPGGTGTSTGSGSPTEPTRVVLQGEGVRTGGNGESVGGNGFIDPTNLTDTDGDKMPDTWETNYGLDPLTDDRNADSDGDGIRNADEYLLRTSPRLGDTDGDGISDANADSDGDGIRNATEIRLGTQPWNPDTDQDGSNDGLADPDGDGVPSASEDQVGTDPATAEPTVTEEPPALPVDTNPDPQQPPQAPDDDGGDPGPVGTQPDPIHVEDPADDDGDTPDPTPAPSAPVEEPSHAAPAAPVADPTPPAADPAPAARGRRRALRRPGSRSCCRSGSGSGRRARPGTGSAGSRGRSGPGSGPRARSGRRTGRPGRRARGDGAGDGTGRLS